MMTDWLREAERWAATILDASLADPAHELIAGPPLAGEWGGQGTMAAYLAGAHAVLAARSSDADADRHLRAARDYLLLPQPVHAFAASALWRAMTALRAASRLTAGDEATIRGNVGTVARAARGMVGGRIGMRRYNHAITTANLYDVALRLWPDIEDAERYRALAEDVWDEWWRHGDNMEVAANYEAFAQVDLLQWAERRGVRDEALADPGTHAWIDRALDHFLPIGVMPGYGDTCTMELWPDWFDLFNTIAAWADGERADRARWCAERMFLWVREREWIRNVRIIDEVPEDPYRAKQAWGQIPRTAWHIAHGIESIAPRMSALVPKPPAVRPVVTLRMTDSHELPWDDSWSLMPSEPGARVQDKLVFRLGTETSSPAAMLGCVRQVWHDHHDAGAVLAWSAGGALLLDDSGYMQRYPVFHNLFWAQRPDRPWLAYGTDDYFGQWPSDFSVRGLTGSRIAQMAVMLTGAPHRNPVEQFRTMLLARSGALIVRDRVTPYGDGVVGGQLWHAQTVHRTGPGWAEASVDEFRGMNGPWFPNAPARFLAIDPFSGSEPRIDDQDNPDPYASPHYVEPVTRYFVYWKKSFVSRRCFSHQRELQRGEQADFLTVLLPSAGIAEPGTAVKVLRHEGTTTVLDVAGNVLVLNDGKDAVSGPWGETDAMVLWAEPGGVFAHRTKRVLLRMPGLPELAIETGGGYVDLDLAYVGGHIRGSISVERETAIRFSLGGVERMVTAWGITPVDIAV